MHRLVWRMKVNLGEPLDSVKESKLREIKAAQCINWQIMIQECELIERAIMELDSHFTDDDMPHTNEERAFIKTTAIAIEDCLKRKLKREDIVHRYSQDKPEFEALF